MPDAPDSRESQRRHATVIFADISGFTAMSEKLDPEDVTTIMNDCFSMVERIVRDQGGTVDKYIGDAVMAVFGAENALENAARRAVLASIEIRAGLKRFNEERDLPVPLQVHIGVNSGLVIAGEVGGQVKRDFTVMGDTVNLASRLEDASEKGQIFVGSTTYGYTRDDFEYRKLPPLKLKGKSEPVQAWEALGVREKVHASQLGAATRQISSDLVGREKELAAIRNRISRFLSGEGGIVAIVGEAGIGKSRLLAEVSSMPDLDAATVLAGRCDAVGAGPSFRPFVEILRDFADIKPSDGEAAALQKLEASLEAIGADVIDDIIPFVATLMGLHPKGRHAERLKGVEPDAMEKLTQKAVTDLLVRGAASRPLLLFFEDLHWADLSSVKLLDAILRLSAEHSLLFIFAARPGFEETSERILATARERQADRLLEVSLQPLDERQSRALVRNLLGIDNLPQTIRDVIAYKADGNPFYIEEVVRAFIDQGAVEVRGDRLVVTEKIDSVSIPGTVQEVILSRVERLDPAARRLLQVAAVIGRNFFHRLLVELTEPTIDIEPIIQGLKDRQVLVERRSRNTATVRRQMLAGEREYVFKHPSIQETIYESLLNRTRKELHLRVAETVERVFVDRVEDFYGMLALHYGRAENLDKAGEYLVKAGDEAVRSAASAEALGYFREAYRIYRLNHDGNGDKATAIRLEKSLASALLLTGNLAEARPHFDRALELLGEKVARTQRAVYRQLALDTGRILFRVLVLRGRMSSRPSGPELKEALTLLYSRARVECVADPEWFLFDSMYMTGRLTTVDPRTVDQAFSQWAGVAILFSYGGLSFGLSRRVLKIAQTLLRDDRPADLLTFQLMTFMCDYFEGLWDRSSGPDDDLVERAIRLGMFWDVDTFLGMDAYKQIDLGNWDGALARWDKVRELVDDYGYSFAETNKQAIPLFIAIAKRDLEKALELVEQYLDRPEEMLNLIGLGNKAKAQILQGRCEDASSTLEKAARLIKQVPRATPFHSSWYRTAQLMLDVAELDLGTQRSDRTVVRSVKRRLSTDTKAALSTAAMQAKIRPEVYRLVGSSLWLTGRARKAIRWWNRSILEATRLGALPELARTHAEIGRRLATSGDSARQVGGMSFQQHAESAQKLMLTLGLGADLHDLESWGGARSSVSDREVA